MVLQKRSGKPCRRFMEKCYGGFKLTKPKKLPSSALNKCFECGGTDIEYGDFNIDHGYDISQECKCEYCGARFVEHFKSVGIWTRD